MSQEKINQEEMRAGLPKTPGYRYAKHIGNQLYVSGQVPHDALCEIVGVDNPAIQALKCFANLEMLMQVHGFQRNDIQQMTIYVVGPHENLALAWDTLYESFPNGIPPATLLGVAHLAYENQLVEVDATIIKE